MYKHTYSMKPANLQGDLVVLTMAHAKKGPVLHNRAADARVTPELVNGEVVVAEKRADSSWYR